MTLNRHAEVRNDEWERQKSQILRKKYVDISEGDDGSNIYNIP